MRTSAVVVAALSLTAPVLAGPQGIKSARIESRSAASGLAPVVKAEIASRPGPAWIGWSVATPSDNSSCCWSSDGPGGRCRGCQLEERDGFSGTTHEDGAEALESSGQVRVLLRALGGRVGRVRAFSEDCPLDAGGLPLVWLEDVRPAESVAWLATLVGQPKEGREGGKRLDGAVTMAIAFHADPSADATLERFLAAGEPLELRKQAAFWMGQARGERGYEVLKRVVREDGDRRLREHAVFALTQSREPKAIDTIIDVARRNPDGHVRDQTLF
jgi:hypothetical protein